MQSAEHGVRARTLWTCTGRNQSMPKRSAAQASRHAQMTASPNTVRIRDERTHWRPCFDGGRVSRVGMPGSLILRSDYTRVGDELETDFTTIWNGLHAPGFVQ